jgi:hypothetical protein
MHVGLDQIDAGHEGLPQPGEHHGRERYLGDAR